MRPMGNAEPFTQVYAPGWKALAGLAGDKAGTRLYVYLAEEADTENALVANYETLCEALEMSERTIRRAVARLVEAGHITIATMGTTNVYVINREHVWKSAIQKRGTISIRARALLSRKRNPNFKADMTTDARQLALPDTAP